MADMATIPSKYSKSGMQGNRGQGFVLSVLILRVQRKQRTKNCSLDVATRRFKKKIRQKPSRWRQVYHGENPLSPLFYALTRKQP